MDAMKWEMFTKKFKILGIFRQWQTPLSLTFTYFQSISRVYFIENKTSDFHVNGFNRLFHDALSTVLIASDKSGWVDLGNYIPQWLDKLFSGIRSRYFLNTVGRIFVFSNKFGDIICFQVCLAARSKKTCVGFELP